MVYTYQYYMKEIDLPCSDCGYLKWRKDRPYYDVLPPPNDNTCGIPLPLCQRLNPNIPEITIEKYGPLTDREIRSGLISQDRSQLSDTETDQE